MKKGSGRFGGFLMSLLLLLIGAALLYGSAYDTTIGEKIADALRIPLVGICLGALMVISVVLSWLDGARGPKDTFIEFKSEEGEVSISSRAVSDFVQRIGKEFAAIRSIDTKLKKHKNSLDIALAVSVGSGNKIPELIQMLQQRVRDSVRESLGIEEIGTITVKIKDIVGEPVHHEQDPAEEIV